MLAIHMSVVDPWKEERDIDFLKSGININFTEKLKENKMRRAEIANVSFLRGNEEDMFCVYLYENDVLQEIRP